MRCHAKAHLHLFDFSRNLSRDVRRKRIGFVLLLQFKDGQNNAVIGIAVDAEKGLLVGLPTRSWARIFRVPMSSAILPFKRKADTSKGSGGVVTGSIVAVIEMGPFSVGV